MGSKIIHALWKQFLLFNGTETVVCAVDAITNKTDKKNVHVVAFFRPPALTFIQVELFLVVVVVLLSALPLFLLAAPGLPCIRSTTKRIVPSEQQQRFVVIAYRASLTSGFLYLAASRVP